MAALGQMGRRARTSARTSGGAILAVALLALFLPASAAAAIETFSSTGKEQTFTVPAGVFRVDVTAIGGSGAASGGTGGTGAQVSGEVEVTPGETLYVEVAGNGAGAVGGFNGGGAGGGGGGGASDVRTSPASAGLAPDHRLLVAGGGGGGGSEGASTAGATAARRKRKATPTNPVNASEGGRRRGAAGVPAEIGTLATGTTGELGVGGDGGSR